MNTRITTLATSLALISTATFAQQKITEEVIVSASLLPVSASSVASAFTVIGQQEIENRKPVLVSDMLRDVPGLAVSRNGVLGSSTQIRVRGAEANHLLVLIDGVEVNDPGQGDELNWGTLTAGDIERIEVVRGPQSVLHGSDAIAGVVNIITRSAKEPFSIGLFSEAGSYGTFNNGINLGASAERFNIRLGATHIESDGDNISRNGNEDDSYNNTTANLKSTFVVSDDLKLGFTARQNKGSNDFDETDYTTGLPTDANSYSDFLNRTARFNINLDSFDGRWQQQFVYSYGKNDSFSFGAENGNNASTKKQFKYLSSVNFDNKNHTLTALLEREEEAFKQRGAVQFFGDPNQNRERNTDSIALEYRGRFFHHWTVGLSARADDNSEFDNAETNRLETGYELSETTRLRAAIGSAVKNPTFSERFGFYTNFIGNPDLEPEETVSWEVGIDQSLFDNKAQLAVTWFDAELDNEINGFVYDPVNFGFTAENQPGTSKRQGIEIELSAKLSETLQLNSSFTYTDAEEQNSFGVYSEELRRPKQNGSVSLAWQASNKLQLNVNAQYNGSQKDVFFPPYPQPSQRVTLDNYTLLNLNVNYQLDDSLALYLKVDNALDEQYEEVFGYSTLGAGAYVGFRYNFAR
jgi:vitamin B12 transporter